MSIVPLISIAVVFVISTIYISRIVCTIQISEVYRQLMAAVNGSHEYHLSVSSPGAPWLVRREGDCVELNVPLYQSELQSSMRRLGCPPNFPNVEIVEQFNSRNRGIRLRSRRFLPVGTRILSERQLVYRRRGLAPDPSTSGQGGVSESVLLG